MKKVDLPEQSEKFAITLENILTKEECQQLIEVTEKSGYSEALVNTGGG